MRTTLGLVLVLCGGVYAADIPAVQMSCMTDGGMVVGWTPTLTQSTNSFTSQGSYSDSDGDPPHWVVTWDMTVDTDPFINGVFGGGSSS